MSAVEAILIRLRLDIRLDSEALLRTMALCYLADWKAALDLDRQITPLKWVKVSWGPYAPEIVEAIVKIYNFRLHDPQYGTHEDNQSVLGAQESNIIDNIREKYVGSHIDYVIKLVKSTYPMLYNDSEESTDLVGLARVYKEDFAGDIKRHRTQTKATVSVG